MNRLHESNISLAHGCSGVSGWKVRKTDVFHHSASHSKDNNSTIHQSLKAFIEPRHFFLTFQIIASVLKLLVRPFWKPVKLTLDIDCHL